MGALISEKEKNMSKDTVQDGVVVLMDYKLVVDGEVLDFVLRRGSFAISRGIWQCHSRA